MFFNVFVAFFIMIINLFHMLRESDIKHWIFAASCVVLSMFFMFGIATYKSHDVIRVTSYSKFKVLRLFPTNQKQVSALRYLQLTTNELDFWTDATVVNSSIDVMISPDNIESFEDFLSRKNISYELFLDDVQRLIDLNAAEQKHNSATKDETKDYRTISWRQYHRMREIYRYLNWLSIAHPSFVRVINIGKSYEGRPLRVIKIGRPNWVVDKPAIWIDAGCHAREWIAPATAIYIIDQLVNNYTSHRELVDGIDWYILPVVNPDGYEYSHTHLRLWRKTRQVNRGNCVGTDPNRNFGFFWNQVGTSLNPCSDVYAGEKPFSEPETKAIADFITSHKNFKIFLTLHSYKQLILLPWGHTKCKPKDFHEMIDLGQRAVEAIKSTFGTSYQIGSSIDLLYTTSGSATDWAKGVAGIKYTYTMELRDMGKFGFLLPASEILHAASETMEAVKVFGERALNM